MMDEKSLFGCLFFLLVKISRTEVINPKLDSDVILETNHEHDFEENCLYPNHKTFIEFLDKMLSDTDTITGSKMKYEKIEKLTFITWYRIKKQVNSYTQRRRELKLLRFKIKEISMIYAIKQMHIEVKDDIKSRLTFVALQWYALKCQNLYEILLLIEQEFKDHNNVFHHTIGIFLDVSEFIYKWIS